MNRFQRDTAVEPLGGGRFGARIDRGWWIVRGPNGGYVAAILLRALRAAVADPARLPRSFTVHFTSPPVEGPAEVATTLERVGRSVTTATARLEQGGKLRALALAAFGTPRRGPDFALVGRPEVTPPERATPLASAIAIPMRERFESRAVFAAPGAAAADAVTGGWIRLREDPGPVEPELVATYTDAWPPAMFSQVAPGTLASGVPTVDLTVHFRAPWPADEDPGDFALVVFRSRLSRDGFVEEDGEVWTRGGVLLAQSRQLALVG
jgi:acyl-CoA thioesterase